MAVAEAPARLGSRAGDPGGRAPALLVSIFAIAACGLVYELLIATVSSYLLGNSVTQFSLAIGVFIGAMGLGSHFSQRFEKDLLRTFVAIEILLGLAGGFSVALLFAAYATQFLYTPALYGALVTVGTLAGLELPLLTRVLHGYGTLRQALAQALSFDYLGALAGSVAFPLLLLPTLGLMRTAFLVGLVNVGVAAWTMKVFRSELARARGLAAFCLAAALALSAGFAGSLKLTSLFESELYSDEIILAEQTPYQRIVVTRWKEDLRLYLDGNLQFASQDEYRYHEALVHPAASLVPRLENVLILGGGDGLAARELLKYPGLASITLVDIDPAMTRLGREYPAIAELNGGSLKDPRVRVLNADAQKFLESDARLYDLIVVDMPDPNTDALAKLYSSQFYRLAAKRLAAAGGMVVQATSPFASREAFWCVARTLQEAGLKTAPYHAYVPSFGEWGFVAAASRPLAIEKAKLRVETRFLTEAMLPGLISWGKDLEPVDVDPSTMDKPVILEYYLAGWKKWE